jgi:hypothetical protein
MSIKLGEKMPLDYWHTYSKLKVLSLNGPLHVELWRENRKIDASILIDRKKGRQIDWEAIYSLSKAIKAIADDRKIDDLSFSLSDINEHINDLGYLFQGVAPSLRFECDAEAPLELGVTSLVYYSVAKLTEWTFGHTVRRQVLQDTVKDNRRRITAGSFELLETYALKHAGSKEKEMIDADYTRLLHSLEEREHPLGFGELGTFIRALQPLG